MADDDVATLTPIYLESTHWPVLRDSSGRVRRAADQYGDVECPFCDTVLAPERTIVSVGDKCRRCSGTVIRIAPWNVDLSK